MSKTKTGNEALSDRVTFDLCGADIAAKSLRQTKRNEMIPQLRPYP